MLIRLYKIPDVDPFKMRIFREAFPIFIFHRLTKPAVNLLACFFVLGRKCPSIRLTRSKTTSKRKVSFLTKTLLKNIIYQLPKHNGLLRFFIFFLLSLFNMLYIFPIKAATGFFCNFFFLFLFALYLHRIMKKI